MTFVKKMAIIANAEKERTNEMMTEIERIRKKFRATREQFGKVFVGKSGTMIKYYEKGKTPTPASVLRVARIWENFLDSMNGTKKTE